MPPSRSLTIAALLAPPLLIAGGWLIFFILKAPPSTPSCDYSTPDASQELYRRGLGSYATASAVLLGVLIAKLSSRPLTLYALGVAAWAVVVYNGANDAFAVHAMAALAAAVLGGEVIWLLSAIAAVTGVPRRGSLLVYLWTSLVILLPAATGLAAARILEIPCMG